MEIYDSDDSPNEAHTAAFALSNVAYTAAFGLIDDTDSDLETPAMMHFRVDTDEEYEMPTPQVELPFLEVRDASPEALPQGYDQKFTFGQYRGWTYYEVITRQRAYVVWALKEKSPNPLFLGHFVDWVHTYFVVDNDVFKMKETPSANTTRPVPESRGRNKSKLNNIRKDPNGPCPDGCTTATGTYTGSNASIRRFTCYKCGYSTQTPVAETPQLFDPAICPHANTDSRGSTKTTHRTYCKDCKQVVEEMPQDSWRERQELGKAAASASHHTAQVAARAIISEHAVISIAQAHQIANLTQQLMTRAIVSAEVSSTLVPSAVLISAVEDAIDAVLQAPPNGQVFMAVSQNNTFAPLESSDDESDAEHYAPGIVIDDPDQLFPTAFPLMPDTDPADLPWVDIFKDENVWAVLDEGCNSSCHGSHWAENAAEELNKLG